MSLTERMSVSFFDMYNGGMEIFLLSFGGFFFSVDVFRRLKTQRIYIYIFFFFDLSEFLYRFFLHVVP